VLWAGVIEVLTSWPNPPEVPAPPGTDRVVHHLLYAILACLSMRAGRPAKGARVSWVFALAVLLGISAFGAADEWHQQFIPRRAMELGDWVADSAGALLGILAWTASVGAMKTRVERTT
jgi:VanZ family protein